MTTVTFQDGRKLTFNSIYFANEVGEPQFFLHRNISFSLSNKYTDFKNMLLKIAFIFRLRFITINPSTFRRSSTSNSDWSVLIANIKNIAFHQRHISFGSSILLRSFHFWDWISLRTLSVEIFEMSNKNIVIVPFDSDGTESLR